MVGWRGDILTVTSVLLILRTSSPQDVCECGFGAVCVYNKDYFTNQECDCNRLNAKGYSPRYEIAPDGTCRKLATHCNENPCGPNEECKESFGMGLCECALPGSPRYLTKCDVPKKDYLSGILIYYAPYEEAWVRRLYFVFSKYPTPDYSASHQIVITLDNGRKIRRILSNPNEPFNNCPPIISCREYAASHPRNYDPNVCDLPFMNHGGSNPTVNCIEFPLNYAIDLDIPNVMRASSLYFHKFIGRLEILNVQASLEGVTYFDQKYVMYVNYYPLFISCMRAIKIHGCSRDSETATIYERQASIVLSSSFVPHFRCRTVKLNRIDWSVSTVYSNEKLAQFASTGEKKTISPLSFNEGQYTVETMGVLEGSVSTYGGSGVHYQYQYCYMKITKGEMRFAIDGGDRTSDCRTKLTMEGLNQNGNYKMSEVDVVWSCSNEVGDCGVVQRGLGPHEWTLECDRLYTFVLNATDKENGKSVTVTAQVTSEASEADLLIRCTTCGKAYKINPDFQVTLTAVGTQARSETVQWSAVDDDNEDLDVNKLKESSPAYILKLPTNSLKAGRVYSFTAKTSSGSAKMTLSVNDPPTGGTCHVTPTEGIRGMTKFNVTCQNWKDEDEPLKYDVVDVYPDRIDLISTSSYGDILNFPAFSENIQVRIVDCLNLGESVDLSLKLKSLDDPTVLPEELQNIEELFDYKNYEEFLDQTALCSLLLQPVGHPKGFKQEMLKKIEVFDSYDTFLYSERVVQIIYNLFNRSDSYEEDADLVLLGGSETVANFLKKARELVSVEELKRGKMNPSTYLLKDFASIAMAVGTYQYPEFNYTENDFSLAQIHQRRRQRGMENVLEGLNDLVNIVSRVPEVGDEEPYELSRGGLTVMSMVGSVGSLQWMLTGLRKRRMPTLQFSGEAAARYSNDTLSLNLMVLGNEIFSWAETNTTSLVAQFSLKKLVNDTLEELNEPPGPFYVTLPMIAEIETVEIKGMAKPPSFDASVTEKDRSVSVHHVEVPVGTGVLEINWDKVYLQKIKMEIKYLEQPSFESVYSQPPLNTQKIIQAFKNENPRLESDFYVGIISAGNSSYTFEYSFNVTIFRCLIWSQNDWRSDVCTFIGVGELENGTAINCSCDHLSFFSSQTFLPPNRLVLSEDIYLFASILQNMYVAVLVGVILLFYLILTIWGAVKDRIERRETAVVPFEDNYPGDTVPYTVAVYTSARCAAGTSSKVAIQVIGDKASSRVHILKSSAKPTLRSSTDDWFLMYTKKPLGRLKQLILWHDNGGKSPDWCCMRVIVYDSADSAEYMFPVESWFQVTENTEKSRQTAVDVFKPDAEHRSKWMSFVTGHALSNMRDKHHWASIFIRHPRSLYTRSERATIAAGFLLTSMLASMLFFDIASVGPADFPLFYFSLDDFISSVKATVISTVLTFAIIFFFQKSKTKIRGIIKELPAPSGKKKPSEEEDEEEEEQPESRGERITKFLAETIKSKIVEPVPFKPVVNDPSQLDAGVNAWLIIAWVVALVTILACAFFIVLFGLKFGVKKSLVWIATFMLSVFSDLLVVNPLTLVLIALLVAYIFKTSTLEAFTLNVEYDRTKAPFRQYKERLNSAIRVRTRPEYKPMLSKDLELIGWKRTIRRLKTELAFSSVILLLLGTCVTFIMHFFGIEEVYFNNLQLKTLFSENSALLGVDIDKVYTMPELYDYLQYSNLPGIHRIRWYNGKTLEAEGNEDVSEGKLEDFSHMKGFVVDYSSKLLGVPRLRQQRLAADDTRSVPKYFAEWYPTSVYGALSWEDEKDYLPGWKEYNPKVRKHQQKDLWWYMNKYISLTGEYLGKSGVIYLGSGYPVPLSWALTNSTAKIVDLSADDWVDNRTRSIFFETNLYNANSNLFTMITVIAEALPNGLFSAKLSIETASILFSSSDHEFWILILVNVIAVILIVNVVDALYYLSRKGVKKYIANWSGFNNLALIAVGLWFLVVFFTRYLYFVLFTDKLEAAPRDAYTSLFPAFNYDFFAHCVTGLFILCITSISITMIHGSIGYARFRKALELAKSILIALFVINILLSYFFSLYCFIFGTLYIERLGILYTFKEVPPFIIQDMYSDWRQQLVVIVGLAILIMFLFNKAAQIWFYGIAAQMLGREYYILAQILASEPPGRKENDEKVLKEKMESALTRWRKRHRTRKKGGGGGEDARGGYRGRLSETPRWSSEEDSYYVREKLRQISQLMNKL